MAEVKTSRKPILEKLLEYLKGQSEYVDYLATIACKLILIRDFVLDCRLKETALITGSTGVGKTYGLECLSKIIDVPLFIADASTLTEAGYKGNTISKYVVDTMKSIKGKTAIIVFDEIGKMIDTHSSGFLSELYFELLKIIEDSSVMYGSDKVDISNVVFILSGSFERIRNQSEGIYSTRKDRLTIDDYRRFGLLPEFLKSRAVDFCRLNLANMHGKKFLESILDRYLWQPETSKFLDDVTSLNQR